MSVQEVYPVTVLRQGPGQFQQAHTAFLCVDCRMVLLQSHTMYLPRLDTVVLPKFATRPTRAELMLTLEAQGLAPCAAAVRARMRRQH